MYANEVKIGHSFMMRHPPDTWRGKVDAIDRGVGRKGWEERAAGRRHEIK